MTAAPEATGRYALLPTDRPADALEGELLARWEAEGLFAQTLAARAGGEPFVFYEGPPTANGRPGIHHVFARTVKDLFCRHRAMRGHDVARKAGWDTHGLPVEIEVEKQLGISGKQDIERVGVEEFNRLCRESVWKYRADWEQLSSRIGYWLDYDDAYATLSHDYVESVWWALKTLHAKDRLYRGHKILPYCPRCGTALSSHEVAQGYQDVMGPSVYVALDLVDEGGGQGAIRRRILVWTTTPWTLVSNTALAVNPELEYVELRKKTGAEFTLLLADARAAGVLGADWADRWDVVARMRGDALVGRRYRRPLDWVELGEGEREVIVGESFVSAEDGSGVVHMAPAFGADDYAAGRRHGLAFVQPVNGRGQFDEGIPQVGGLGVKAADPVILEELERRDVLWKAGERMHSYPHCWRCGTPLLYYARSSWFVRTTAFKDEMLARNAQVGWRPPEVGDGRFGEWLRNNVDWAVSRDRYWGTPLPVWVNDADPDEIEVVGSYAELAAKVGAALPEDFDPHKPHVDRYTWPAPSGTGTMRRVSEVIDTWFDSGSMPFAQWHYPFENRETFERQFPGDFIAEGVDQTRGWFYSLLAIATGLGDALPQTVGAAPYRNVVVNDLVLDASGQKMSKSKGNTVDPWEVLGRHGADSVRLFLVSSSQVWVPRRFDEGTLKETAGRFLVTFKNVYSGIFAQYANFGWEPTDADPAPHERPAIDRWVLSRLASVEREADGLLGDFDATGAVRRVMEFFDADVSKWYVRRSRDRFYDVHAPQNRSAFATLHEVLAVTARLLAPFAPFVTDWVHRELTGTSVHLASYTRPVPAQGTDAPLESAMAAIRELVTQGHAARDEAGINVRQPLSRMVCVVPQGLGPAAEALLPELLPLLAVELNVKAVEFASSADAIVTLEAKPNFRALGKRFGKSTPLAAQAVAALTSDTLRAFEQGAEVSVSVEGASHLLEPDDVTIVRRASGALVVAERGGYFAALDAAITPELRREGLARELVSRVQRLRKETGLAVSDRIVLTVDGDAEVEAAAREHRAWIADEVLATRMTVAGEGGENGRPAPRDARASFEAEVDGLALRVTLSKDDS